MKIDVHEIDRKRYTELEETPESEETLEQKVWICSYYRPNIGNKPVRHVPPTEVSIPGFYVIGKRGVKTQRKIPFSHRLSSDVNILAFTTKEECIAEWKKQIKEVIIRLDTEKDLLLSKLNIDM